MGLLKEIGKATGIVVETKRRKTQSTKARQNFCGDHTNTRLVRSHGETYCPVCTGRKKLMLHS